MDEAEPPPPHAGERLTREDVLRLIAEHGGPEGLDLHQADLSEVDLREVDLHRGNLRHANLQQADLERAELHGADLRGATVQGGHLPGAKVQGGDLRWANLQEAQLIAANLQQADLRWASLQKADLRAADLQEANLSGAKLEGADLHGADLRRASLAGASLRDAQLEGVKWGDYVLGDEVEGDFAEAASVYRVLKQWHTEAGMYDIAGEFFYREMEARRKLAWRGEPGLDRSRRRPYALSLNAYRFLYGYGERPERVIGWVVAVILGFALGHWLFGTVAGGFWDALYYSAVSFTALGYGWASEPQGWAGKFLGVGESLLGVFMMALFLVTFTRKMTR